VIKIDLINTNKGLYTINTMQNEVSVDKLKTMLSNLKSGEESLKKLKEKYKYNAPNKKDVNTEKKESK
jgi:hypothetical protein